MRAPEDTHVEIADMTPEERGQLIQRVRAYDWPNARKESAIRLIMMLGLVGQKLPTDGRKRAAN